MRKIIALSLSVFIAVTAFILVIKSGSSSIVPALAMGDQVSDAVNGDLLNSIQLSAINVYQGMDRAQMMWDCTPETPETREIHSKLSGSFEPAPGFITGGLRTLSALTTITTTRVSVSSTGEQGNDDSYWPAISADGRYVAYVSYASNLVPGDTNGERDIILRDQQTGQTSRASISSNGEQGNGWSYHPAISSDGRYVAFESRASNLVPGDTNGYCDIFVHDRQTGQTSRVTMASDGSQTDGSSFKPTISADGRYVAFYSDATNLVLGDTNDNYDIFVHDRQSGQTSRVSVASDGNQAILDSWWPAISADGRYVAFDSGDSSLVPGDTNEEYDVFVHDQQSGQTRLISVASDGTLSNGFSYYAAISGDGRFVAFESSANNLVPDDTNFEIDIFVQDQQTGQTTRVSLASDGTQGNDQSRYPVISADGNHVAFESWATNLVPGDTNGRRDNFVHDRRTGETIRISVASDGTQANSSSYLPAISADGRYVAFYSYASNLVPGDTNSEWDIFVHDRGMMNLWVYLPLVTR